MGNALGKLELDNEKDRRLFCKVKDTRQPFPHALLKNPTCRANRLQPQNISGVAGVYRAN
jgi:hypothetical protein